MTSTKPSGASPPRYEFAEGLESPLLVAYTDAAWAELLVDRAEGDDLVRARAMAERALAAATAGGYGYIERDAAAVLTRSAVGTEIVSRA